ncbi:(d)CMP kinase [Gorillibacterium sp. sgz5001074]|uniref:(d)CMP kinase n=1 Tax=Gorillibacterium sp. sgz5001074 TaxID=3446695 RepID=UPI003F664729
MGKFNIALDGPAGAGKSTVARLVAKELDFVYVDTGAMYRAITWKILSEGIPLSDTEKIAQTAARTHIVIKPGPLGQTVELDGTDVTERIRSTEINQHVSHVAAIPRVREVLVHLQKQMASSKGVVMDGRDIGTSVLPDAEVKVYLTASARRRAERRFQELTEPGMTLEELERDIERRDQLDRERKVSPLRQAEDAILLDSTDMSLEQVVHAVLDLCRMKTEWR